MSPFAVIPAADMSQTHARADLLRAMCDAAQRGHVDVVCQTLSALGFEPQPGVESAGNGRAVDNLSASERSLMHLSVRLALQNDWDQVAAAIVARAPDGLACFQFERYCPRERSVVDTAAFCGSASTLNALLSLKTDIDAHFLASSTQWAAFNGQLGVVRILLRHRADPNTPRFWETPLYYAAQHGHTAVVKCLLAHKAENCKTALPAAVLGGHNTTAALLRRYLANMEARNTSGT